MTAIVNATYKIHLIDKYDYISRFKVVYIAYLNRLFIDVYIFYIDILKQNFPTPCMDQSESCIY